MTGRLQRELAVAYERLADVEGSPMVSNLGNTEGALDSYRKSMANIERLNREVPGQAQFIRDRSRLYSKMSDMRSVVGDLVGALDWEIRAREVREAWVKKHAEDRAMRRALANSLQSIAGHLEQLGRYEEALKVRRQALEMVEQLNASGPVDSNLRLALALANKRLGRSLHRSKNYSEAIPYFLKALEIEKQEVARDTVRVNSRVNLSFSWNDMGVTQLARGEYKAALECFEEALKLREGLVESNPKDVRSASLLATTKLRIGMTLAKLQRAPREAEVAERSAAIEGAACGERPQEFRRSGRGCGSVRRARRYPAACAKCPAGA